ncbi:MAG: SpvB/TcaC N-terminal domain-containing protein, partial [Candidatus Omnitrophica bacterium]|nr:SpvB/TcaC N-terminal domain-containing protein [Candidatus Omnitrophota bacterium]
MKKNQFLFGLIIIPFLFSATPALAEESQEKTSQVQGKEIKNQSILENIELPKKINNQDDLKQTEIAPKAMITGDRPFESMEKLDVDPASGTASASIPLQVPRGRGGVEPALALAYNSGSSNGLLGVGWFLDLGKIGRSTKFG